MDIYMMDLTEQRRKGIATLVLVLEFQLLKTKKGKIG